MSSSFRLRRMIKDQKANVKEIPVTQRINSPLAKYQDGELKCIVCDTIVRSEKAWPVHINSKKHKDSIVAAKELKERVKHIPEMTNHRPVVASMKRPATPPPQVLSQPVKKLKGILKNSNSSRTDDRKTPEKECIDKSLVNISRGGGKNEKMEVEEQGTSELPDGFFDNPREDAKVQLIFLLVNRVKITFSISGTSPRIQRPKRRGMGTFPERDKGCSNTFHSNYQ